MKTLVCVTASFFVLFALNGSAEETQTDGEYDYGNTGCPIPVLGNYKDNMAKYVGCSVKCGTGISKVPDNTSCYEVTTL
ncbi:evasin P983-like [Amblyomma americanum]